MSNARKARHICLQPEEGSSLMVMGSHKHEFIFLKTRKTAGTSVEMALEPWCRPPRGVVVEATPARLTREGIVGRRLVQASRFTRWLQRPDWRHHMTAAEIKAALGHERWDRYKKITTVRNPFDLLVSRLHFKIIWRKQTQPQDFATTRAQFNQAVAKEHSRFNFDYDILHMNGVFLPDHVIRFESLQEDLNSVFAKILPGEKPVALPRANAGTHHRHETKDYYDPDSIAIVLKNAGWLFDRFGYPRSPGGSQSTIS